MCSRMWPRRSTVSIDVLLDVSCGRSERDRTWPTRSLARRVQEPKEEDWIALKRMLHYIRGTQYSRFP